MRVTARGVSQGMAHNTAHKSIAAIASIHGEFSSRAFAQHTERGTTQPTTHRQSIKTTAIGKLFGGGSKDDHETSNGVFAAKKRSAVRIPGLLFQVAPRDVFDESKSGAIESIVAAGATAIVLSDPTSSASTRELFDAALALKSNIRGRCALLVADRADLCVSAEADGVVLGDDGVPVVVARKSLPGSSIVAVTVSDSKGALVAAKEGADLIIASGKSVVEEVAGKISVPVFAPTEGGWDGLGESGSVDGLIESGAAGFAFTKPPTSAVTNESVKRALNAVGAKLKGDIEKNNAAAGNPDVASQNRAMDTSGSMTDTSSTTTSKNSSMAGKLIDSKSLNLLQRERELLDKAVAFLQTGAPELEEIDLLIEARKGLEELFLLVIVGEFNAGKSSVINAVLGEKFLKEGILPTTNEITVLKYGEKSKTEQSSDGFYTQTVPAELLKEVNIVDTPGTNVILERQQRLTEEFVPRADLVLFVLSADRPMTESEIKFLSYIKKWGKKVVFIVNKCDRLENEDEVEEVKQFVVQNAERLLGVTDPAVMPVSAKSALAAKKNGTPLSATGFDKLEEYVLSFLGGGGESGGSRGGEGMRLKLNTPLQVSELLFQAAEDILQKERDLAVAEVKAATGVGDAMEKYADAMSDDFAEQRNAVRSCVLRSVTRCDELLDDTLRLTNGVELFTTYVLGNGGSTIRRAYKQTVLGDAESELKTALAEHTGWLIRNNSNQLNAYAEAVKARGFDPKETDLGLGDVITAEAKEEESEFAQERSSASEEDSDSDERSITEIAAGEEPTSDTSPVASASDLVRRRFSHSAETSGLAIAAGFDHTAAAALLEEEIKNAVYATVGAAAGAFLVAVFLSGFLDSLAEDVLAFSLTAAVGYVSVLSLPLKRAETKAKVRAAAEDFLGEIENSMRFEFERKTLAATKQVLATTAPWSKASLEAEEAIKENQATRDELQEALDLLKRDVQSL